MQNTADAASAAFGHRGFQAAVLGFNRKATSNWICMPPSLVGVIVFLTKSLSSTVIRTVTSCGNTHALGRLC